MLDSRVSNTKANRSGKKAGRDNASKRKRLVGDTAKHHSIWTA